MNLLAFWIPILAAAAYAILAGWRVSIGEGASRAPFLALAFLGMAVWAAITAAEWGEWTVFGQVVRSTSWLLYLHVTTRISRSDRSQRWLLFFEGFLLFFVLAAAVATFLATDQYLSLALRASMGLIAIISRLVFSILAVIYVHNLYRATTASSTSGFRIILIALGILWGYDVNLYTVALLGAKAANLLFLGRTFLALALVPIFTLAARRKESWRIGLSRQATFQTLSLIALGMYFVGMSTLARGSALLGGALGTVLAATAAVLLTGFGAILIFSPYARRWLKVVVTKHLFRHRYDYRSEWLRFSSTIGAASEPTLPPEERVIKSIADVMDAPGGILLLTEDEACFEFAARWNWRVASEFESGAFALTSTLTQQLAGGMIMPLDMEKVRGDDTTTNWEAVAPDAWIAVPLIRLRALIGVVILARPLLVRELDWEDFDLLKVIGQQAAVHIADAQGQLQREEAKRFEEFNRRFAFIIHDIKNVVSQMSLLAANAREHGANPRFQADMTTSLTNAVQKMNVLLSRIAVDRNVNPAIVDVIDINALLSGIANARVGQHPIHVSNSDAVQVMADRENLKLAIDHIVQNAIESSLPNAPITLSSTIMDGKGVIMIADTGAGMSPEFIRRDLFKAFVSTKASGFGIGAAEAKALIIGMGGTLNVKSIEGRGTCFTIALALNAPQKPEHS